MSTYHDGPSGLSTAGDVRSKPADVTPTIEDVAGSSTLLEAPVPGRRRVVIATSLLVAIGLLGCAAGDPAPTDTSIYPASLPGSPSVYGSAIGADSLANSVVGGPNGNSVAYRFRATESAQLESITIYIQTGDGYSAGDGGTLEIAIHADDGSALHVPAGAPLAKLSVVSPEVGAGNTYQFPDPPELIEDQLYHVVYTNSDAQPEQNYVSVNGLYVRGESRASQPGFPLADWANLVKHGDGEWSDDRGEGQGTITPILGLSYANGETAGMSYMEVWIGDAKTISDDRMAREVFTVSGPDRTVTAFSVRLERVAGSGPLEVRLMEADGDVIEQGEIPAGSFGGSGSPDDGGPTWATLDFDQARTLESGEAYEVVISAPADSSYSVYAVRKGIIYGYGEGSYFSDGRGEFLDGSEWEAFTPGWYGPGPEGDLQFFFSESTDPASGTTGSSPA